jgi:hypothetical protein
MKIRAAGVGLIGIGILFAVLFIYLPIHQGPDGFMGRVRLNALVFVPLAIVTGLSFVIAGGPALWAFQARPKSKGQLAFVLSVLIGSGVLTGISYRQLKTRWLRPAEPVILDASPRVPQLPSRPEFPERIELPKRPDLPK